MNEYERECEEQRRNNPWPTDIEEDDQTANQTPTPKAVKNNSDPATTLFHPIPDYRQTTDNDVRLSACQADLRRANHNSSTFSQSARKYGNQTPDDHAQQQFNACRLRSDGRVSKTPYVQTQLHTIALLRGHFQYLI